MEELPVVQIGGLKVDGVQPVFILGPCVIESEAFVWDMAQRLKTMAEGLGVRWIFKASYDKANRTAISSYRGLGCEAGCRILGQIGKELGVPVTTDVHTAEEAVEAAQHIDLLQIPAFLCRQTDLLLAAAATGRTVNVKKGQFLSPQEMVHVTGKLREGAATEIWQTERGTTFGYQNLVVDMRSFAIMAQNGYPTVFDATHAVQLPGAGGGKSSGERKFVPPLAKAALAAGADGLFIETHPDPANAISDGPNMIPLDALPQLLAQCLAIWKTVRG